MIAKIVHVGVYYQANSLIAQIYGKEIIASRDRAQSEDYPGLGESLLRKLCEDPRDKPEFVVIHPGLYKKSSPISKDDLIRIAQGASKASRNDEYNVGFRIDETPINLGRL